MLSREAEKVLAQIESSDMKALFRDAEQYGALLDENGRCVCEEPGPDQAWVKGLDVERAPMPSGAAAVWKLKKPEAETGVRIVYFHGGGFILPCGKPQWEFAARLVRETGAEVDVVLYPLAPRADCVEACAAAMSSYEALTADSPKRVVLIGDSAGGYLSIACAQIALGDGLRLPDAVIALSPVVDFYDRFEGRDDLDSIDPLISLRGLRDIVDSVWAPADGCKGVFPPDLLAGPMTGLPPMYFFVGGREVLLEDSVRLARMLGDKADSVELHIEREMWHTYPLFMEMPEAGKAIERIAAIACGERTVTS